MKAIFLDIETNGLDPNLHKAIEFACVCIDLHKMMSIFQYSSFIKCTKTNWTNLSDSKALEINGIQYEELKNAPDALKVGERILEFFHLHYLNSVNTVIICQNPTFDRMFFSQIIPIKQQLKMNFPYHWLDLASMAWMKLFAEKVKYLEGIGPLSKDNLAKQFGISPEQKPHRALSGVIHLIECYKALLKH